jgi:DNA polymerase III epsilon subunit-like protein
VLAYYVIDLETTGLSSHVHEVFEISIIRATDRMQLSRTIKCENPERASFDALRITGKTLADLETGSAKEAVVSECEKFLQEDGLTPSHRCIVGHNIYAFDRKFLHALWNSVSREFPAHLWLDTIPMIKAYAKQIGLVKPRVKLQDACDIVGVKKYAQAHSAKMDSRNSYLLWKDLVENKRMDYLPFIKIAPHQLTTTAQEEDRPDLSLLDY